MEKKIYGWNKQLAEGKKGEVLLAKFFGPEVERCRDKMGRIGTKADFRLTRSRKKFELKTERYSFSPDSDFEHSGNAFIEVFSQYPKKLGGPFVAAKNGCEYFAHLFSDGYLMVMPTEKLLEVIHKRYGDLESPRLRSCLKSVKNEGYYTKGLAVSLDFLKPIACYAKLEKGKDFLYLFEG